MHRVDVTARRSLAIECARCLSGDPGPCTLALGGGFGSEGAATVSKLPHLRLMPLLICAALLAIGYLTYTTSRYFIHNYQLGEDEAQIRRDMTALDHDHAQLVAVRDYLKSDEYIEDIARRILGLVRPGETLVVVSSSDSAPAATPQPAAHTPGAEWWKDLFERPDAAPTPSP